MEDENGKSLLVSIPTPLPPSPEKPRRARGSQKVLRKILRPKGLGVKILRQKHLAEPGPSSPTASP